jgi:cell division protein FtsB
MARTPRRPATPGSAPTAAPSRPMQPKPAAAKPAAAKPAGVKPTASARPTPRGSSRRRVPVAMATAQTQASAWMAGVRGSGFTLLIMGIMILAVIVLAPSVKTFVEQRAQIAELQQSVDAAKSDAQNLDDEQARWSDPAYIRAQARDRLYYVMPGEISYLVLNDVTVATENDTAVSDALQQTDTDWVQSLLSSVVISGTGEQTPDQLSGSTPSPTPTP